MRIARCGIHKKKHLGFIRRRGESAPSISGTHLARAAASLASLGIIALWQRARAARHRDRPGSKNKTRSGRTRGEWGTKRRDGERGEREREPPVLRTVCCGGSTATDCALRRHQEPAVSDGPPHWPAPPGALFVPLGFLLCSANMALSSASFDRSIELYFDRSADLRGAKTQIPETSIVSMSDWDLSIRWKTQVGDSPLGSAHTRNARASVLIAAGFPAAR